MAPLAGAVTKRWFWYSILTIVGWAGWAVLLKIGSIEIPSKPSLFIQTFGMVPLAVVLAATAVRRENRNKKGIAYSILNGLITGIGILCLLAAYRSGGNTSVVSVTTALYPLVTFALAAMVLREKLSTSQVFGLALATVAIILFSL